MPKAIFSKDDMDRIASRGLSHEAVLNQLDVFKRGPRYTHLLRPCTAGDGITVIEEHHWGLFENKANESASRGRSMKFVPASGAATRMFKSPLRLLGRSEPITKETLALFERQGDKAAIEVKRLMASIEDCAFYPELQRVMASKGLDVDSLLEAGDFEPVLRHLVGPEGLDYGSLPKGLLLFHRYPEGPRTAFEEHLVESADYAQDSRKHCRLHFTVSPEHMADFRTLAKKASAEYGRSLGVTFRIDFSTQSPDTDTIAVDMENRPFRLPDGRLLFRPGGHGSLLRNLAALGGDIVYIKNIDNVVPDRMKKETGDWKKILCGLLVETQRRVFGCVEKLLAREPDKETVKIAETVFTQDLSGSAPENFHTWTLGQRASFLLDALNRPIRVCGMVRNEGEPGGGPFWVKERDGRVSLQIIESAQVDPNSAEQQVLLKKATHFNPVDLVCGLRDVHGKPFDLETFVDPATALISTKSRDGKELKALEHPGLWNGGMAGWLTVFVEVPLSTFNPVKTVNDLLRPSHQAISDVSS
jgi:hypothetical protein